MSYEMLPEKLTYCYDRKNQANDPVMEALIAPAHPTLMTSEKSIIYAAVPIDSLIALYAYHNNSKNYKLLNVRYINLFYYLASNPFSRLGDTTIALAVPQKFNPGTSLLPISRLAPIYRLDIDRCKETLHIVQAATAMRATRQGLDLIISMITTTLTLLALNLGPINKLKFTLEGLIQAYLSKASLLASSILRAKSQEITRIIDISSDNVRNNIYKYLNKVRQSKNNSHIIGIIINNILKDSTIMSSIIGRITKGKGISRYTGTLDRIKQQLKELIDEQAKQLCDSLKGTNYIAYGVTGQFSLYDIKLIHEILLKCGIQDPAYLLITPETIPNLTVTINTLRDINSSYVNLGKNILKITLEEVNTYRTPTEIKQLRLKPLLIPYTDPHILLNIKRKLQEKNVKILNPINVILI